MVEDSLELLGARVENSCSQWDFNPVPSAYEANALAAVLLELMSIEHFKVDSVLPDFDINLPVPNRRSSQIICRVLHFINSLQSAYVLKLYCGYLYTRLVWLIVSGV